MSALTTGRRAPGAGPPTTMMWTTCGAIAKMSHHLVGVYYRLQTKLRESNVFTHVCQSTGRSAFPLAMGQADPPQKADPPSEGRPPRYGQPEGGTHRTGMLTC